MKDARHAVTLRASGIDILMHVGIDTVALGGRGFDRQARRGLLTAPRPFVSC